MGLVTEVEQRPIFEAKLTEERLSITDVGDILQRELVQIVKIDLG